MPLCQTTEPVSVIDAPSLSSGNAFCTVKKNAMRIGIECSVKVLRSRTWCLQGLYNAGVCKENDFVFPVPDLFIKVIEIFQLGDIPTAYNYLRPIPTQTNSASFN